MARVWIAFALAAALLLSWARVSSLDPHREVGILPIDPPTPFYRFVPASTPLGRVLVIHGLDASKELMQVFCAALSDAGFEAYAIDLPGHGDSPVGFNPLQARDVVARTLDYLGGVDAVVGHSLGAGLLLDLANDRKMPRMVLLSPPPTPIADPDFSQTLIVTGVFDIPAINSFSSKLEGVEWWRLPWTAHSTTIFNATHTREIIGWMGGHADSVRTGSRMAWNGLKLGFAIALGICLLPFKKIHFLSVPPRIATVCGWFVLAGIVSLLVLKMVPLMHWLKLFATDYAVALVFLLGSILSVVALNNDRASFQGSKPSTHAWLVASAAAAYVIVVVGFIAAGHFLHFALTNGRAWRFVAITVAGLPLFLFDEIALRGRRTWSAIGVGILSRCLIGAFLLTGVLVLNREDSFLVLVSHMLVAFWIALWFLTEVVRRHTQNALATALFAALVQGWAFAAWFVKI